MQVRRTVAWFAASGVLAAWMDKALTRSHERNSGVYGKAAKEQRRATRLATLYATAKRYAAET